jgi:two-component system OmpR family sensor kinase
VERTEDYARALAAYCLTRDDTILVDADALACAFVADDSGPADIVETHVGSLPAAVAGVPLRQRAQAALASHQFLLEVVIAYGTQLRDHLEEKAERRVLRAEKRAARDRARAALSEQRGVEQAEALMNVAHELGQPLTALSGNLQLAERAVARGGAAHVRPSLGRSREALSRLSRMVDDLHRSARGEALAMGTEPVDLAAVAREAVAAARPAAAERGIALTGDGISDAPRLVAGDADALLSVIGNLLSNALRYTPTGGTVTVRQSLEGGSVLTEVRDTGIGMTPKVRARIFDRLYRAPEARKMATQGLGVGLSLAKRLTAAHGGTIEVESAHGKGSAFRILLPLASETTGRADPPQA